MINKCYKFIFITSLLLTSVLTNASDIAPNQYIVIFKKQVIGDNTASNHIASTGEGVKEAAERLISEAQQNQLWRNNNSSSISSINNSLGFVYENTIHGFSATLTDEGVNYLEKNPLIDYIEPDYIVDINTTQIPTPSWGLDRIDQADLPLNNIYEYTEDGSGVHAYIVDTGIRKTHTEFTGRIGIGRDIYNNDDIPEDCHGHGTHVAGTVGGSKYGVAKNVTLHSVKVFGCSSRTTTSTILAGINWIANNAELPAVVNMSVGGPASQAYNDTVQSLIATGIPVVASAGNNYAKSACTISPASAPNAITVASSTKNDKRSSFSNIGLCIDIFAPGSHIISASHSSDTAFSTKSGTSMAAPHVTGAIANYLERNPKDRPAKVAQAIIHNAVINKITDAGTGTPNLLLQTQIKETPKNPIVTTPQKQARLHQQYQLELLYIGFFNRSPDRWGFCFWKNALESGVDYNNIAKSFYDSPEFDSKRGKSRREFIQILYRHLLKREASLDALNFWEQSPNPKYLLIKDIFEGIRHQKDYDAIMGQLLSINIDAC